MDNVEKNYKIAFISDLHFDNISENTDNGISFLEAEEKKAEFIACLKRYFNDYIVCIVGDCYSNYKEMLNFIEELEQNKIYGFFVLGNHDYWSNGQKTYMEIIQFFKEKTNHFSYFRFLCTGKSYKVGELCFIGDTGWTSFKRDRKEVNKQEFNRLPENVFVKDFSCEKIIEMHNAWIEYANQMICKEKKLIILTHFPMVDFTETAYDCWWSSKTRFKIKKILSKHQIKVDAIEQISLLTRVKLVKNAKLKLGKNVIVSKLGDIFIGTNGSLQIDDKVYFNKGVFISCQNKIHIEKNCQFGPDVKIIDNNHKFSRSKGVSTSEHTYGEITIGENSWIGANAVLLKKAKIGKNCVIGAGCVINQEIPDYSIVTLDSKNIVVESMRDN